MGYAGLLRVAGLRVASPVAILVGAHQARIFSVLPAFIVKTQPRTYYFVSLMLLQSAATGWSMPANNATAARVVIQTVHSLHLQRCAVLQRALVM